MEKFIAEFPIQLAESIALAKEQQLKIPGQKIENVVICGLGGSGIGAKIVSQWIENEIEVPITIVQNYTIPSFINTSTLVIGSSYSGNTEETLTSLFECQKKSALIAGISSGGELEIYCKINNYNHIKVPGGYPPRAALAFSVVQLLNILFQYGLISDNSIQQLTESLKHLVNYSEEIIIKSKEVAELIDKTNAVIYAESTYECVAIRGKQQFNENSKYLCRYHVIPEMNHNELLGWGCGNNNHSVIFLRTDDMDYRNKKRFDLTTKIIESKTNNTITIQAKGRNRIERSLYLIHLLDWASYFLGIKRNEDVMEIKLINFLKSELAKE
jgi:glucose/mannose-6-phosphate isomerase